MIWTISQYHTQHTEPDASRPTRTCVHTPEPSSNPHLSFPFYVRHSSFLSFLLPLHRPSSVVGQPSCHPPPLTPPLPLARGLFSNLLPTNEDCGSYFEYIPAQTGGETSIFQDQPGPEWVLVLDQTQAEHYDAGRCRWFYCWILHLHPHTAMFYSATQT